MADIKEKDSLYGGNPVVYEDAVENMKNTRKLLKDRMKPAVKAAEEVANITATEKVRLQGTKETKAPVLKPYTEAVDVKDRAELSKLIGDAKKENKSFKIGRSMKEGFRYTFLVEARETVSPGVKVGTKIKIINMQGEPGYTGKVGEVKTIDDAGQLHGTWGGLALIPGEDKFEIVGEVKESMKMETKEKEVKPETREVKHLPKKPIKEAKEDDADLGVEVTTFEQMKELSKGAKWETSIQKYFDMYVGRGFQLFVKGEGDNRILTFVKDGNIVKAVDIQDRLVVTESIMGSKVMKPMKEETVELEPVGGDKEPEEEDEEEDKDEKPEEEKEGEAVEMVKSQLRVIQDAVKELQKIMGDEELPEWAKSQITLASDYVDGVRDFIKSDKEEGEEEEVEAEEGEAEEVDEEDLEEALVEPKPGEKEADYVSRFMGTKRAKKDFPNQKQRLAVAYSKFNAKKEGLKEAKPDALEFTQSEFFPGEDGDTEAQIFIDAQGLEDFDLRWDEVKGGWVLSWSSAMDESKHREAHKKDDKKDDKKQLKEDVKIITSLESFKPWSGAVKTWDIIVKADKLDALDFALEDLYPDGIGETELNDLLWFEEEWVLEMLGLTREVDAEEDEEVYVDENDKVEIEAEDKKEEIDDEPVDEDLASGQKSGSFQVITRRDGKEKLLKEFDDVQEARFFAVRKSKFEPGSYEVKKDGKTISIYVWGESIDIETGLAETVKRSSKKVDVDLMDDGEPAPVDVDEEGNVK